MGGRPESRLKRVKLWSAFPLRALPYLGVPGAVRHPGQSQPVSLAIAGALTPASPIVSAAVATTIAALRRKAISRLPRCGVLVLSHPSNLKSVGAKGSKAAHGWLI